MGAPWLDKTPTPDPRELDPDSLVEQWSEFRNSLASVMAAEEMMRRIATGKLRVVETIELTDEVTR